jgi:hypothetical protein
MPRIALSVAVALLVISAPSGAQRFSARVDNPWFPLVPGRTYHYEGAADGRRTVDVVAVTRRVERISGVPCTVVHDRLFVAGRLIERTVDWYAQDRRGTVWYFGEATAELDADGRVVSTEGSWQAGHDGARPGIFMPAHPRVGPRSFQQEHFPGHAEDRFRVVSLRGTVRLSFGTYRHVLVTREWTPLEPGVIDRKRYVRGVGLVSEESVRGAHETAELVSVTPP